MAMPPLQPTTPKSARERGIAVMLTAFLLVFTIPAVGLAIDAGVLYLVRSKLSSACDAAALATARNLNLGLTLEDQQANAIARGTAFFNANFPAG
jgi:Flp pilus assembly protein TadG